MIGLFIVWRLRTLAFAALALAVFGAIERPLFWTLVEAALTDLKGVNDSYPRLEIHAKFSATTNLSLTAMRSENDPDEGVVETRAISARSEASLINMG